MTKLKYKNWTEHNNWTNQKQELPVEAMFVNGSELNEQSLYRTFQGCFLRLHVKGSIYGRSAIRIANFVAIH
jgi:hypothetical protein